MKVRAYEKFLDERLRPELLRTEERRRAVLGELQVYVDLEANIASLLKAKPSTCRV